MEEILALQAGHTQVFEQVYHAYHEKLYFYFLKHTRSQLWAEELLQTTFVKLWRHRQQLSAEHTLSEQLFRIAKTSLIDMVRHNRHQQEFLRSYTADLLQQGLTAEPTSRDTIHQLHREMEKLPPVRKKVFMLSRIDGLSHKEISHLLSISPRTVEVHITKALKQLRRALLTFLC
ncbi:RNA polymerase sigma-70 factor [Chitinophaga agrisoli]|uniref:RNA polymerase sigma-70 factor n=1 Tax=Chitinophaga agrisoli TaxID=2607653 RepID=A0A5B2VVF9_9BACT|nr:RNA polymerase sigma-70 factor [Chitinophaga agrisoli]KAA2242538.1 RNA polymerase sigma-70 factor [Chitinophaga agrisoli]